MGLFDLFSSKKISNDVVAENVRILKTFAVANFTGKEFYGLCNDVLNCSDIFETSNIAFAALTTGAILLDNDLTTSQKDYVHEIALKHGANSSDVREAISYSNRRIEALKPRLNDYSLNENKSDGIAEWLVRKLIGGGEKLYLDDLYKEAITACIYTSMQIKKFNGLFLCSQ